VAQVLGTADVAALLAGKRVAVVGNATSALDGSAGEEIDGHDAVLRLNAGVPGPEHHGALGRRTDILSVGNLTVLRDSMYRLGRPPLQVWFGKPRFSRLGTREWGQLQEQADYPIWRIPHERMQAIHDEIGAWPSGGLVAVDAALEWGGSVDLYGFDWFRGPTWWHSERPDAKIGGKFVHDGAKERAWMERRGLIR